MNTHIFHRMRHDLKGHQRSDKTTFQNHSSTFVNEPIFMKICMNANIIVDTIYDLKCHFCVMEKFCDFFNFKTF